MNRDAANAAGHAAAARKAQCEDIRAALPWFPGFETKESV